VCAAALAFRARNFVWFWRRSSSCSVAITRRSKRTPKAPPILRNVLRTFYCAKPAPLWAPFNLALNAVMELMQIFFLTWFYYLVGAFGAFAAFIFMRVKRVSYSKHEHWVLVAPFIIWSALMLIPGQDKSLSNLIEPFFIGLVVSSMSVFRLLLKSKVKHISLFYFALSCLASVAIFMAVPGLPE